MMEAVEEQVGKYKVMWTGRSVLILDSDGEVVGCVSLATTDLVDGGVPTMVLDAAMDMLRELI